jgi:hypothetical protein
VPPSAGVAFLYSAANRHEIVLHVIPNKFVRRDTTRVQCVMHMQHGGSSRITGKLIGQVTDDIEKTAFGAGGVDRRRMDGPGDFFLAQIDGQPARTDRAYTVSYNVKVRQAMLFLESRHDFANIIRMLCRLAVIVEALGGGRLGAVSPLVGGTVHLH